MPGPKEDPQMQAQTQSEELPRRGKGRPSRPLVGPLGDWILRERGGDVDRVAEELGVTGPYFRRVVLGAKPITPGLALALEKLSGGSLLARDLVP